MADYTTTSRMARSLRQSVFGSCSLLYVTKYCCLCLAMVAKPGWHTADLVFAEGSEVAGLHAAKATTGCYAKPAAPVKLEFNQALACQVHETMHIFDAPDHAHI